MQRLDKASHFALSRGQDINFNLVIDDPQRQTRGLDDCRPRRRCIDFDPQFGSLDMSIGPTVALKSF